MLKRKATDYIKNWLNTKDRKCLVVQGARQTGKTYIIERFAEENFEELVEINFKQMPSAMEIFAGDLTVDNMVMAMRFRFPDKKIIPGKTLIFLDEIQECQEAITSLKFWAIDNRYDVVTSGSLLGIDYKRASSYPVGYVDYLRMYGMDFEEFLGDFRRYDRESLWISAFEDSNTGGDSFADDELLQTVCCNRRYAGSSTEVYRYERFQRS